MYMNLIGMSILACQIHMLSHTILPTFLAGTSCMSRILRSGKYFTIIPSVNVLKLGYFLISLYQFDDICGPLYIVMSRPNKHALAHAALPSKNPFSPARILNDFAASLINDMISSRVCLNTPCKCSDFLILPRTFRNRMPVNRRYEGGRALRKNPSLVAFGFSIYRSQRRRK